MPHLRHQVFEIALEPALALGVGVFHHLADVVDGLLAVTAAAHTATVFRVGGEIAVLVAVASAPAGITASAVIAMTPAVFHSVGGAVVIPCLEARFPCLRQGP